MTIYFSLGTNLGDKGQNLLAAVALLGERVGEVAACSTFYTTAPWGFESANSFVNAACRVEVAPLAGEMAVDTLLRVLHTTQEIERELGRTHKSVNRQYKDRLIDIDLLLAVENGEELTVQTPELTLPHPLMQERDFVMTPLKEIMSVNL